MRIAKALISLALVADSAICSSWFSNAGMSFSLVLCPPYTAAQDRKHLLTILQRTTSGMRPS